MQIYCTNPHFLEHALVFPDFTDSSWGYHRGSTIADLVKPVPSNTLEHGPLDTEAFPC